mmetsp:Transcript_32985/g.37834  ORF Transcript_32985/g.37834 Transcript_32985/m.37834 type:complete len:218 (-) Transcript_32985:208-861(-)
MEEVFVKEVHHHENILSLLNSVKLILHLFVRLSFNELKYFNIILIFCRFHIHGFRVKHCPFFLRLYEKHFLSGMSGFHPLQHLFLPPIKPFHILLWIFLLLFKVVELHACDPSTIQPVLHFTFRVEVLFLHAEDARFGLLLLRHLLELLCVLVDEFLEDLLFFLGFFLFSLLLPLVLLFVLVFLVRLFLVLPAGGLKRFWLGLLRLGRSFDLRLLFF